MHAQNDVNYMPVESEAGTPICGPFLTTNGCIDVYDLKGKLRWNLNLEQPVDVEWQQELLRHVPNSPTGHATDGEDLKMNKSWQLLLS